VPRAAAERVARLLGARGPELLAALERPAERGEVSAAVRELVGLGEGALFAAGARHVAPALATLAPLAVRQMAQRLRRPLGETLLAEVRRAAPDARRAQVLLAALRGR
jgi:hypothetical protein